jgi:hypothetical protein
VINRLNRLWWRGSAMQVECTYWCITILHIFPIISRYFLHMKQILAGNWRPGGPRPFHRNLCFFFRFFGGSHAIWGCDLTTLPATLGYLTQGNAAVICDMRWAILC